jgi:prevent-host-death family protein
MLSTVNMSKAKSNLSDLVRQVETGACEEIIMARDGKPVARLVPLAPATPGLRIGVAKGEFVVPDSIDPDNLEIAESSAWRADELFARHSGGSGKI